MTSEDSNIRLTEMHYRHDKEFWLHRFNKEQIRRNASQVKNVPSCIFYCHQSPSAPFTNNHIINTRSTKRWTNHILRWTVSSKLKQKINYNFCINFRYSDNGSLSNILNSSVYSNFQHAYITTEFQWYSVKQPTCLPTSEIKIWMTC